MRNDRAEEPREGELAVCQARNPEPEAVRRELERLAEIARLADEAPSPVLRVTLEGRLSYANAASAPLLEAWGSAVGRSLPAAWAERVRQAFARETPSVAEVAVAERVYALMLTPVPAHGEVNLYAMDITVLRQTEEALRRSEEHLRWVFEQAPIGIALIAPSGALVEANRALSDMVGYTREELACLQWRDLVHPEDAWQERWLVERVVAGDQTSYRVEERIVTSDGSVRWTIVDGAPLHGVTGEPPYLVVQVQDVTERRRAGALAQRVAIAARVEEAQEQERRRVAQELHDRVGQELSALSISLDLLRIQTRGSLSLESESRLDDAVALVRGITASVRNVMSELRPPMLDDYGLLPALRWYARLFARRVNIAVRVAGREPAPRLSPNAAIMLFRIAQEALSNVARHAEATRAEIRLTQRTGVLRLTVADNGRGFDLDTRTDVSTEGGWGLRTMAERAAALQAHFRVESRVGGGTRVVVELPWSEERDAP